VRFPAEALVLGVLVACYGGGANAAADPPAPASRPALGTPITSDEIRAAAAKLRANPDLGGERKFRSLRWTQSRAPDRPQKPPPWIEGLFEYLGQTGSVLIWVAGAIAAAIAVIWAYRTFKARTPVLEPMPVPSPTRTTVEMDIRPESLPDDIGAAALARPCRSSIGARFPAPCIASAFRSESLTPRARRCAPSVPGSTPHEFRTSPIWSASGAEPSTPASL
jgi:hypothetical protein